ncbi:MAG: hypothetical protein LBV44_03255 [Methylobacillus sp.]|nr:hypothetical protein [Methylobacillus sp.]
MTITRVLYKVWRVLRWLLLAVILLVLGFIALVWWENRHDEPLLPEVAEAIRFEPPTPEQMRDNGYFTMLGLRAPPDEDAAEAGQRFFAAQMKNYARYLDTGETIFSVEAYSHQRIDWESMRCEAEVADCYAYYLEHAQKIKSKLSDPMVLTERYLSLLGKPTYEEIVPPYIAGIPLGYADVAAASILLDIQAALLLNENRTDEALTLLETNAKIHRRMMQGSRTLMGALVALAMDMRQQRLISSALRHIPALSSEQAQRLDALVESSMPVPLTHALEGERQMILNGILETTRHRPSYPDSPKEYQEPHQINWLTELALALAYLPNATANDEYSRWKEIVRLSLVPADQLEMEVDAIKQKSTDAFNDSGLLPFPLRNFVGSAMIEVSSLAWVEYVERAHDVEAYHRLIRLQIAALRERVPFEKMPTWLADQPPELRNPYTLQPMDWDAATQSLVFTGAQRNTQNPAPGNVFRVYLGKP